MALCKAWFHAYLSTIGMTALVIIFHLFSSIFAVKWVAIPPPALITHKKDVAFILEQPIGEVGHRMALDPFSFLSFFFGFFGFGLGGCSITSLSSVLHHRNILV